MSDGRLWIKTPLIRSSALSERLGTEVYLKIEVSGISARRLIRTDLVGLWQTFQNGRSYKVRHASVYLFRDRRNPNEVSS